MTELTQHLAQEIDLQKQILAGLGQLHELVHGAIRATASPEADRVLDELRGCAATLRTLADSRRTIFANCQQQLETETGPANVTTLRDFVACLSPVEQQTLLDQRQELRLLLLNISERHTALGRSLQLKSASQIDVLQRLAAVLSPGTYDVNGAVSQRANSIISARA